MAWNYGGLDPKWVAKAFGAVAKKMDAEPGDYVKKAAVSTYSYSEIVVTTAYGRYFRIDAKEVTYKPTWSARSDKAVVIAKNRA